MPILPGIEGERRMSKSLGNYVGVTDPPEEMFGKLMRVPDDAMLTYYALLLDEPFDPSRAPVESKRALAGAITSRYHGDEAARAAEARFDRLHVERAAPDDVEEFAFSPDDGNVHLPALLADAFGISRSEGRRLLAQQGVKLDGAPLEDLDLPAGRLDGGVIQVGRRRFKRLRQA